MRRLKADLHTHSTCSDGAHSPSQVVGLAAEAGIRILSLTDHDTTRGLSEATRTARGAGLELVPGIEISSVLDDSDLHILGYFIGSSKELTDYEAMMSEWRTKRLEAIVERLRSTGLDIEARRVRSRATGVATRLHVAQWLVDEGHAHSVSACFEELLGPGCVAYVPSGVVSAAEAIAMIHRAGGCASLAHPGEWMTDAEIELLVGAGLDAVEVVHPAHDERLTEYYDALTQRKGLLRTGGSDLHSVSDGAPSRLGKYCVSADDVQALGARASRYGGRDPGGLNQTRR